MMGVPDGEGRSNRQEAMSGDILSLERSGSRKLEISPE